MKMVEMEETDQQMKMLQGSIQEEAQEGIQITQIHIVEERLYRAEELVEILSIQKLIQMEMAEMLPMEMQKVGLRELTRNQLTSPSMEAVVVEPVAVMAREEVVADHRTALHHKELVAPVERVSSLLNGKAKRTACRSCFFHTMKSCKSKERNR